MLRQYGRVGQRQGPRRGGGVTMGRGGWSGEVLCSGLLLMFTRFEWRWGDDDIDRSADVDIIGRCGRALRRVFLGMQTEGGVS